MGGEPHPSSAGPHEEDWATPMNPRLPKVGVRTGAGKARLYIQGGYVHLFDKMEILKITNLVPRRYDFYNPLYQKFIFYPK